MLKSNCGNENSACIILHYLLPEAMWPNERKVAVQSYEDCLKQKDGLYILQDMPIPFDWAYSDYECEFDPHKQRHKILAFARQRFGDNSREPEILEHISKCTDKYNARSLDFVVIQVENHKATKYVTLEIASDDHFVGKCAIQKTISDAMKCNGTYTQTRIIDTRKCMLYTLESQMHMALAKFLTTD